MQIEEDFMKQLAQQEEAATRRETQMEEKLKREIACKQQKIDKLEKELDRERALNPPPNHGRDEESNQNKKGKKKTSMPD